VILIKSQFIDNLGCYPKVRELNPLSERNRQVPEQVSIRIINAALDETPQGVIILRGVVDPESLNLLKVADYQREILAERKVAALMRVIATKGVPSIILGMRGQNFTVEGSVVHLLGDVYIIDGLQRVTAALRLLQDNECDAVPHLGVEIYFDTTEESELEMFQGMNTGQSKLSSNVILRNARTTIPVVQTLYRLTLDKGFSMSNRVTWQQNKRRQDLITATTFMKVVGRLHSHAGPGRLSNVLELAKGTQKIMDNVGRKALVGNVRTFFDLVDRCWGVQRVAFINKAPFIQATFLLTLARVLSDHTNFWNGDELVIDAPTIRRLQSFPVGDPEVARLASGSEVSGDVLYFEFVKCINYGRKARRLVLRPGLQSASDGADEMNAYEEAEA